MQKQYTNEKSIKKALHIKSFEELPLDKYDDLAKLLTTTKKEVAISIINQLPEYMTYAKNMVGELSSICQNILEQGKEAHNNTINSYMRILENLEKELQSKRLSKRRKDKITSKMLEVAEKIAQEGTEHRLHILEMFKVAGGVFVAMGTLVLSAFAIIKK